MNSIIPRPARDLALITCLVALAVCQTVTASGAVFFGPPEVLGNPDGNSGFDVFARGSSRFQQVYESSIFGSLLPTGGGWIYEIDFRVDPSLGHAIGARVGNLQINISTTPNAPDGLSSIFDQNTGNDDHVVFGPASRGIDSPGGFNIAFTLAQPFFYNPAQGNLLLDFRIYQGIGNPLNRADLDAFNVSGDSVSSLYAIGSTSLPTVGQPSTLGLATAFFATPVPEPSSVALLAIGLLMLGGMTWKRVKKRKDATHAAS